MEHDVRGAGTRRWRDRHLATLVVAAVVLAAAVMWALLVLTPDHRAAPVSGPPPATVSQPTQSEWSSPTATPIPTATPTPSPSPSPSPTNSPTPEPDLPTVAPRAAFIGDSYTQGGGAEPDSERWSTVAAAALGWTELNFGRGGTGFVTSNSYLGCGLEYCPTYVETVPEVVAAAPDIVVVAGGQNDFETFVEDPDAVRAAISETYNSLRAGLPQARMVAVGPSTPWEVDDVAIAFDAAIRTAASAVGAQYVGMLEPNVIDPAFLLPDGHVNNDGHRVIAERIVAALASG
jgi:lysophospholipase L1-like esterase